MGSAASKIDEVTLPLKLLSLLSHKFKTGQSSRTPFYLFARVKREQIAAEA